MGTALLAQWLKSRYLLSSILRHSQWHYPMSTYSTGRNSLLPQLGLYACSREKLSRHPDSSYTDIRCVHSEVQTRENERSRTSRSRHPSTRRNLPPLDSNADGQESNEEYFKNAFATATAEASRKPPVDWNQFVDPDDRYRLSEEEFDRDVAKKTDTKFGTVEIKFASHLAPKPTSEMKPRRQSVTEELAEEPAMNVNPEFVDSLSDVSTDIQKIDWEKIEESYPEQRPLEPVEETDLEMAEVKPAKQPFSYNLASYANESDNIKRLIEMGVQVWRFDRDKDVSQLFLTGEWEVKIQPWVDWMLDTGLEKEDIKSVLERSPRILLEKLPELQEKVEYFRSKKFDRALLKTVLIGAPIVFSMTVRRIDKQLGELQHRFGLIGQEVRDVMNEYPKFITYPMASTWNLNRLCLINEMGFTKIEVKKMLLKDPRVFVKLSKLVISDRFDYLHNVVGLPHAQIAAFPDILMVNKRTIRERHLFLKALKRNQYDPKLPNYVSPTALCFGTDAQFCSGCAKESVWTFDEFCKTL
ncbi:hypothetical protein RvY_15942 [Ramazzottius varieornatus]|uniref:Uncharacterized protein n=1 Tax=Ramazzottius varieornatus TaxID=947166 RepID=A0A1D1W4I1_RAMVA|nr:hypothetical protein RvY_15942 [Ramazzottius varieornatus]